MSRLSEYVESVYQDPVTDYINQQRQQQGGGGETPRGPERPFPPSPKFAKEHPTIVPIDDTHVSINGQTMTIDEARRRYANDPAAQGDINEAVSRTRAVTTTRTGTELATGTTRRYVDVPTPEQFLDEFRNGFATHIRGLRQTGTIGVNAASWLLDNIDIFWSEYLGRLGEMAQRGEPVFRATSVTPEVTPLGTRPGQVSAVRTQADTVTQQAGTQATTTGAQVVGGAAGGEAAEAGIAARTEQFGETEAFKQDMLEQQQLEEEVVARPDIGVVHTLSPTDFLGQQFPASSLNIIYQGRRAQRAAQQRVGGPVSPRRVG